MYSTGKWLERLDQVIAKQISEVELSNETLALAVQTSERHLFRKVKEQTGLSPQKYLRKHRLETALDYLKGGKYRTVKETAKAVGYINASYFIRQFEQEFGKKPLQVLRDAGWR